MTPAPWLKLYCTLPENAVWDDLLASRLWVLLLCRAKQPPAGFQPGDVRFSYPEVARALSGTLGRRRVVVSRKQVRATLRLLVEDGRVVVREWSGGWKNARKVGGEQGYVVVTVCNFAAYQGNGLRMGQGAAKGREQGVGIGSGTGSNGHAAASNGSRGTVAQSDSAKGAEQGVGSSRVQRDSEREEERGGAAPATVAAPSSDPLVLTIRQSGIPVWTSDRRVTDAWAEAERQANPGIDLVAEVRSIAAWWLANPGEVRGRNCATRTLHNCFKIARPSAHSRNGHAPARRDAVGVEIA